MSWFGPAAVADVCIIGENGEADWLCQLVFDTTGNEALSRIALAGSTLVAVAIVVVGAWFVQRLAKRVVRRFDRRMEVRIKERLDRALERGAITDTGQYRERRLQRLHAATGVLNGAIGTFIWIVALFWILSLFNVPLQPLLAGAGVIGLVVGFGAQQLVRDVLAGIAMLIEDQYGVGDWIEVDGKIGEVERVGLRSTAFRDLDGTVHHVLNGHVQRVGNLSQRWGRATFDVPLALDSDVPAAKAIIYKVAMDLKNDPVWGEDIIDEPELWGVQDFGPAGLKIRVGMRTKPLRNWDIMRQLRERMKHAFEQANIRQPPQLVDLGGQQHGFPIVARTVQDEEPDRRPRRRGLVPPDVTPLDRPPPQRDRREDDEEPADEDATAALRDDTVEPRDQTTELRIDRGPQPRPD